MDTDPDKTFYTMTMARVYASQGKAEQAARIYRYLLDQTPDRADIRQALEEVSASMPRAPEKWAEAAGLVERWVRLVIGHNQWQRLQRAGVRRLK